MQGQFFKRHALALKDSYDITVLYVGFSPLNQNEYEVEFSVEEGLKVCRVYIQGNAIVVIRNIFDLRKFIIAHWKGYRLISKNTGRIDGVHVCVIDSVGFVAYLLFKIRRIPYIIYEVSSVFNEGDNRFSKYKTHIKFLKKIIVRNARAVAVVASPLMRAMQKHGLKGNYLVVPPTAVDTKIFSPIENKKKSQVKKILHISNLDLASKNPRLMIKAMYEVSKIRNDFRLDIVCHNSEASEMPEEYADELNIKNKYVFFHGGKEKDSEIGDIIKEADFFILTSNFDTFATVISESLACGVPVIITKCGGPESYVTEECGIIVEHGNLMQLTEAIIHMLDNYHMYDTNRIAEYARKLFSRETFVKQIGELYEKYFSK